MARFEIGTVPEQLKQLGKQVSLWCNELVKRTAAAETTKLGTVLVAAANADALQSGVTVSNPPTQAQVETIRATVDALVTQFNGLQAKMRAAGQLEE